MHCLLYGHSFGRKYGKYMADSIQSDCAILAYIKLFCLQSGT